MSNEKAAPGTEDERGHDGLTKEERMREMLRPCPTDWQVDYIEAMGSAEGRRELLLFRLNTATFGSEDERAVRELLEEVAALKWQLITPDNLPKVGDELFGGKGRRLMRMPEGYAPMVPMVEDFTLAGWTHFRPINPPKGD